MNENEVERLLKTYGESFTPCAIPETKRKPVRWNPSATLGFAVATLSALAVIGLWPRNAVAGTVARINQALNDVKTMECVSSMKLPSGWHPFLRTYYANNMWRYDSQIGTNLETITVLRDGMQLIDCKHDEFVTVEKARPKELSELASGNQTALDFAKKGVDFGETGIPRNAAILEHSPVNGRQTYLLTFVRAKDNYRAEIVVDKSTNLPIQSDMQVADERPGFVGVQQVVHTDFNFNGATDAKLFSLESNKTTIRPEIAATRLAQMWAKPLGTVITSDVRAVSVTQDGTVWIATTVVQNEEQVVLPTRLSDEYGTFYVRIGDIEPDQHFNEPQADKIFGKSLFVTGFAPLHAGAQIPGHLTIGYATREQTIVARSLKHDPDGMDLHKSLTLTPGLDNGYTPSYFPLLSIRNRFLQPNQLIWSARARALDAKGDMLDAAKAYEEWAKARYEWVKYSAFDPMLQAARCYRAIGEVARADELAKKAEALKASRER